MRLIAQTRQPVEGKAVLGHNVVPGYLSQEFAETIPPDLSVYRVAKNVWDASGGGNEKEFRNRLGAFGFDSNDIEKPSGVLSGGEKIRLAFLRLFLASPNFLLLDEPTTHLDLDGRTLLQKALQDYRGTILLVSHDIEFVRAVATSVLEITREGVFEYPGGYDYYAEKREERHAGQNVPKPAAEQKQSRLSAKDERRQRAEARALIAPKVKELKKTIALAEKKLEEYQEEIDATGAELFNPNPNTDFALLNKRMHLAQCEIERWTKTWEDASIELEELTSNE